MFLLVVGMDNTQARIASGTPTRQVAVPVPAQVRLEPNQMERANKILWPGNNAFFMPGGNATSYVFTKKYPSSGQLGRVAASFDLTNVSAVNNAVLKFRVGCSDNSPQTDLLVVTKIINSGAAFTPDDAYAQDHTYQTAGSVSVAGPCNPLQVFEVDVTQSVQAALGGTMLLLIKSGENNEYGYEVSIDWGFGVAGPANSSTPDYRLHIDYQ